MPAEAVTRVPFSDRPFLRWAGGKHRLAETLAARVPPLGESRRYFEPFLGAAALFLKLAPTRSVVGDANEHLIDMYRQVRDHPADVAKLVYRLAVRDSEDAYYRVRRQYNTEPPSVHRAAMFIYLNRACYNGVFRVNLSGGFNVPYGHRPKLRVPSSAYLERVAELLRVAQIECGDYRHLVRDAGENDFVYLDPPYPPLNGTAFFTHYTKDRFPIEDQQDVAALANDLRDRGCQVLVTNADTAAIRQLYQGWAIEPISVPRYVTGKTRHSVRELVITSVASA